VAGVRSSDPGAPRLRVVVASHNPAKLTAARRAFSESFPGAALELVTTTAESGVGAQPKSDEETRRGALNRAHDARRREPQAMYWVGIEGGVEAIDGQLMTFAWMAVLDADGRLGAARSATLPLPPEIHTRVMQGEELGEANDAVFGTTGSKRHGGAFGLLTGGRYTREGIYAETLCIALLPLLNPLYVTPPRTAGGTETG
jgi:inosine/xanthosine triphosphatase